MRRIILESPYRGRDVYERAANADYAKLCMRDSLMRGEAPLASHLLYAAGGVLNEDDKEERALGIAAGFAWHPVANASVVYLDRGVSSGMEEGILRALQSGLLIEHRFLGDKAAGLFPVCDDCVIADGRRIEATLVVEGVYLCDEHVHDRAQDAAPDSVMELDDHHLALFRHVLERLTEIAGRANLAAP